MKINANFVNYGLFPTFCLIEAEYLLKDPDSLSRQGLFYLRKGLLGEAVFTLIAYHVEKEYIPCAHKVYTQQMLAGGNLRAVKSRAVLQRFHKEKVYLDQKYAVSEDKEELRFNRELESYRDERYPDIMHVYLPDYDKEIKVLPCEIKKTYLKGICREFYPAIGLRMGQFVIIIILMKEEKLEGRLLS